MNKCVELYDMVEYYILLGKKANMAVFKPLFFDIVTKQKIQDCMHSEKIGTIFTNKEAAKHAKNLLLKDYQHIKVAKLQIIGEYWR